MEKHMTLPENFLHRLVIESANHPREQGSQSEDYILIDRDAGLLGIFDSVGGRDRGLLVSHLAGKTIASTWQSLSDAERQGPPEQIETLLQALIQQADTAIASLVIPQGQKRPGTTAALGAFSCQHTDIYLSVAHIGDSRVYLLKAGGSLQRLTEDNGYFPFAVRRGLLSREESLHIEQAKDESELLPSEMEHFSRRNQITCAVGWTDFPFIRVKSIALVPGDYILLSTDGIHDNLTDLEIEGMLRSSDESTAKRLVNAAYQRSQQEHFRAKQDDISAIVVHMETPR